MKLNGTWINPQDAEKGEDKMEVYYAKQSTFK